MKRRGKSYCLSSQSLIPLTDPDTAPALPIPAPSCCDSPLAASLRGRLASQEYHLDYDHRSACGKATLHQGWDEVLRGKRWICWLFLGC